MSADAPLAGRHLVVAVDAGPRAFTGADLVRACLKAGAGSVRVAVTGATERWIPALTLETLSGSPVLRTPEDARQARDADGLLVCSASADLVARLCGRRADDAVCELFARLETKVLAPATELPEAPWLAANLEALSAEATLLDATADVGALVEAMARRLGPRDLVGCRVLITAGPTREALDPVRYLTNPSSGRMGLALAEAARDRGATVDLCLGPVSLPTPAGVRVHRFGSALELDAAVRGLGEDFELFIASAAVADWRPADVAPEKVKKQGESRSLELVRNPDVLASFSERVRDRSPRPFLVGFAAETEHLETHAREKLVKKGLDLVAANQVKGEGSAFGADDNALLLVDAEGATEIPRASKRAVAHALLDAVVPRLVRGDPEPAE